MFDFDDLEEGEQRTSFGAVKKLGNIVIQYMIMIPMNMTVKCKVLVGKCWEARLPRHVEIHKCCLKGPGFFTKV